MEQRIISLEVAKAIKKAGYPMREVICGRYNGEPVMYDKELDDEDWVNCDAWYLPTYLDVWLWLWREKGIEILPTGGIIVQGKGKIEVKNLYDYQDPEEAIIAAIEYLVDNDLIK